MSVLVWVVLLPALVAFGLAPLLLVLWGRTLPETHETTRSVYVAAPREAVFALLTDVRAIPRWRKTVTRVVVVASEPPVRFRERSAQGTIELEIEVARSPSTIVMRATPARPMAFEGSWTYELADEGERTRVTLTERGRIRSAIARVFAAYALGHATHTERTLAALAQHFRR